jgi:hypothetical protein
VKKVLLFLKKEILEFIPPFIFFFIAFHLTSLIIGLAVAELGYTIKATISAGINALIVGKSILIVDSLPAVRKLGRKRLINMIIWKSLFNIVVVFLFEIIEKLIHLISKHGSLSTALNNFADEVNWPHFWNVVIILSIFVVIYTSTTTLIEAIGKTEFRKFLFAEVEQNTVTAD